MPANSPIAMHAIRQPLLLSLLAVPSLALDCLVPPPHTDRDHEALLEEATHVLLVEARASAESQGGCRLEVIKSWKGPAPTTIPVGCKAPSEEEWMTTFGAHADEEFWEHRDGRLDVNPNCTVMAPSFTVGKRYGVLLGVAPDLKQLEEVAAKGDRWLALVERRFAARRQS
jgi:hypothetical protein